MNPLMPALTALSPAHDPELIEGYQRYVALLEGTLSPVQLSTYAAMIERDGLQILEDLSTDDMAALPPEEAIVATTITAEEMVAMENRRVAALLIQRQPNQEVPKLAQSRSVSE